MKYVSQNDFAKAEKIIQKSIEKDSINPESKYAYSKLYMAEEFARYNTDSAYFYAQASLQDLGLIDEKKRSILAKKQVDSGFVMRQSRKIDSVAFAVAQAKNSEQTYNHFLNTHTNAAQRALATSLRNTLAFHNAKAEDTAESYLNYLNKYPNAGQAAKAYKDFATRYPKSRLATTSMGYAYHLMKHAEDKVEIGRLGGGDSLQHIMSLDTASLLATYQDGLYGFMTTTGKEVITPNYSQIAARWHFDL